GCPTCGETNPRRARFCLACGDPLPAWAGRPGGPPKARPLVTTPPTAPPPRRSVALVGAPAHPVFGVPAAHEDDALRAVRAAAGMHAALAELNQRLAAEGGGRPGGAARGKTAA